MKMIKALLIIGSLLSSLCADSMYYSNGSSSNDDNSYQGSSGQQYQYDMSNGNDRISYSTDIDAQQRDMQSNMQQGSSYQNTQQDQSIGQYGGGVYNGN